MALGMVEVFGFATGIVVADAAAKAADVKIVALDKNKPAAGDAAEVPLMIVVKITGDTAAVEQAMAAGIREAKSRNLYSTSFLISNEAEDTKKMESICAVGHDKFNILEY
jgi:microcompartment protein CcmL/EutN